MQLSAGETICLQQSIEGWCSQTRAKYALCTAPPILCLQLLRFKTQGDAVSKDVRPAKGLTGTLYIPVYTAPATLSTTLIPYQEIRSRHLQVVDRDHSPARFHHEDQRQALSKEMKESAQQVFDGWGSKKRSRLMSTVMAAMEELPKRVGEDMHKMVSHVVDSVQTEINEDEKITGSTKVVRHLEVIPTMVVNLLESRVEKAKAEVRKKVGGMILQLSAIQDRPSTQNLPDETNENDEELAEQMQVMSSEVAQIAGAAVEAATQECRAHATQQLDIVLANLVENHQDGDEHKVDTRWRKVCEIRNAVEEDLLIQKLG
eukprot:s1482_g3.t1